MKHQVLLRAFALLIVLFPSINKGLAQNIQFHFDTGRFLYPDAQAGRSYITTTVEQQSVDKWGDTFYFVDMNFLKQGAVSANWKFMRNLRFWKGPISWHLRYDGGLRFLGNQEPLNRGISLSDAWMTGATYTYLRADRRLMLSFSAMYKYIRGIDKPHNFELCPVWRYNSPTGIFTANGFISFWKQSDPRMNTEFKLMAQPQFWCNLNKISGVNPGFGLSVGTEIRISRNVDAAQWLCIPTVALKWSFNK